MRSLTPIVAACLLGGCGAAPTNIAPVQGRVTLNGEPVKGGDVLFMPTTVGKPSRGRINPDGSYSMTTKSDFDGALIGRHEVEIHNVEFATPLSSQADQQHRLLMTKARVVVVHEGDNVIDLHYSTPDADGDAKNN
jgi:hypothetical protein